MSKTFFAETANAEAWLPIWRPSAIRAIEPKATPAAISTGIVTIVMAMTIRVRRSADLFSSGPNVWSCIHRSTDSVCMPLSFPFVSRSFPAGSGREESVARILGDNEGVGRRRTAVSAARLGSVQVAANEGASTPVT